MRLTLRTLLAYLDGILEPGDAQDLGKKVEESEFATGLVHRIRDVMRRLRLGAPSLTDRGPGLDPNTVAEYLDNTLAPERVTDFEKVCLDSDIHLAEVAACHQILTLVLGEPAEVDPASRQRMYELKDVAALENTEENTENVVSQVVAGQDVSSGVKPPPTPTASSPSASPSLSLDIEEGEGEQADRKPRPRPTVPEYLREPHRRPALWHVAAAVLLALCLVIVVLLMFGQLEPGTPLGNVLVQWGVVAEPQELAAANEGSGENGEGREPTEQQPAVSPMVEPVEGTTPETPIKEPTTPTAPTTPIAPDSANPAPIVPPATPPSAVEPGVQPPPVAPEATKPEVPPTVTPDVPPVPTDTGTTPAAVPGIVPPLAPAPPAATDAGKKPAPELPVLPEPLGRFLSSDQVLLYEDSANGWTRAAANQMLIPQRVLALPTYRAKVALTAGVAMEIVGGTCVELLGSTPKEMPGIRVVFGRVVLMPVAKAGTQLRLAFGDHNGTLTFVDADAVVALEVRRVHAPGTNPEADPPYVTADMYVTTGAVTWDETADGKAAQAHQLASPQRLGFDAQLTTAPIAPKEMPKWITAEPIGPNDRRASAEIARSLPTDRPARVGLLELTTSRPQREVKWLALRCLGYVGQFRDLIALLNDASRKLDWFDYIDALRAAVDRDGETASAVRMALEKQYPDEAADLYRMLWGYTDKDLAGGEDAKLVRFLDDDALAVRVLAYWNLKDITGMGQIYQPEQTSARRQQSVRRWRQRLEAKEIRLSTPAEKAGAAAREAIAPAKPASDVAPGK